MPTERFASISKRVQRRPTCTEVNTAGYGCENFNYEARVWTYGEEERERQREASTSPTTITQPTHPPPPYAAASAREWQCLCFLPLPREPLQLPRRPRTRRALWVCGCRQSR